MWGCRLYTDPSAPLLRAWVFQFDGQDIGAIFYRDSPDPESTNPTYLSLSDVEPERKVMVIDEGIFTESISDDLKSYILTDFLLKLEPELKTHVFCARPVHRFDLPFFIDHEGGALDSHHLLAIHVLFLEHAVSFDGFLVGIR